MKFILQHYNSFILSVYGFAENAMTHKAVSLCLSEHLHVHRVVLKYSQTLWQCVMCKHVCGITKFVACSLFKKTCFAVPFMIYFVIMGISIQFDSCIYDKIILSNL